MADCNRIPAVIRLFHEGCLYGVLVRLANALPGDESLAVPDQPGRIPLFLHEEDAARFAEAVRELLPDAESVRVSTFSLMQEGGA